MADKTDIAWCDSTFNPWIGCTKVGPGCDNCYAKADFDDRKHRVVWGAGQERSRTAPANWKKPQRWNAETFIECAECGHRCELREFHPVDGPCEGFTMCPCCSCHDYHGARRRVFCSSLADVFDNEVPAEWRRDLFDLIGRTPNLDWLLLTKRIGNAAKMLPWTPDGAAGCHIASSEVWPNVWIGATVVNQEEADRDIPKLLATPARVRFLSMEPLLGPVDLTRIETGGGDFEIYPLKGTTDCWNHDGPIPDIPALDWVIVGGESGHGARPMHLSWVVSIVQQCRAAGVPVFVKQLGRNPLDDTAPADAPEYLRDIPWQPVDRKGGDWLEWPEDLRVRQFPEVSP